MSNETKENKKEQMICDNCGGSGRIVLYTAKAWSGLDFTETKCFKCKGLGEIEK